MSRLKALFIKFFIFIFIIQLFSCSETEKNESLDIDSLQQGLKSSAAIGYCISIATAAMKGYTLPSNVIYNKSTGLIYIKIDANHPLTFNKNIGNIVIACLSNDLGESGVVSILFADIDILGGKFKLYGINTVPFSKQYGKNYYTAVFAKEDIVIGTQSSNMLDLTGVTNLTMTSELNRLNETPPTDVYTAVKQNIWFMRIDPKDTPSDPSDDVITVNGGGQIAEATNSSGGIMYHALIDAKIDNGACLQNPISGVAFLQNLKAGESNSIDLGNYVLSFHNNCDGKVHVDLATGKYITFISKNVSLNLN